MKLSPELQDAMDQQNEKHCAFCLQDTNGRCTATVNGVHTCGETECLDKAFDELKPISSFDKVEEKK